MTQEHLTTSDIHLRADAVVIDPYGARMTPQRAARPRRIYRWLTIVTASLALVFLLLDAHIVAGVFALTAVLSLWGWSVAYGFMEGYREASTYMAEDAAIPAKEVDPQQWVNIAPAEDGHGYLYVIRFSNGVVKVGQTNSPSRRLGEHRRNAWAYNLVMTDVWVSHAHAGYLANEVELIAFTSSASDRAKREYFHGADFDQVVRFARDLANAGRALA